MTERDGEYVRDQLPETVNGPCYPLAIIRSRKTPLPRKTLDKITKDIVNLWKTGNQDKKWWLTMSRLFYPDLKPKDIQFRNSGDNEFREILEAAFEHNLLTVFLIDSKFIREKPEYGDHAVGVHLQKEGDRLLAEKSWFTRIAMQ